MINVNSSKDESRVFKLLMSIYFAAIAMRILFSYWFGMHGFLASITIVLYFHAKNGTYSLFFIIAIGFIGLTSLAVIVSSISLLDKHHRNLAKAMPLLVINLFTLIILVSPHELIVLPDFYFNLKDRQAVISNRELWEVKGVTKLDYNPNHSTLLRIKLPAHYSHLSQGFDNDGSVGLITDSSGESKMFIFTTSTIGRGYTAFIYNIDESEEVAMHELIGVDNITYVSILESKKFSNHWFWVDVIKDI
ncbi:hypothetical protein H6F77_21495 [Microcoleus sp. FACHB-831]|uniref:hypothetical protein n=1 Tax=Microcoleus sp. FACHB-831 TaxID=2692827 RepID=UPI0016842439|nr:hypothetical protein [Microcoleus sp. FACHB-831]MBD1923627.1 hypothetical protein [Microcoleus sp. FACHB-831]